MLVRPRLLAAGLGLFGLCAAPVCAAPAAGAVPLLPHKTSYRLVLDGSKPTGQLEAMTGQIDYEIRGDACAGYATLTRQTSESTSGDGDAQSQEITSKAWEDGEGKSYRFTSTTRSNSDPTAEVEAEVTREGADLLKVAVTKPAKDTLTLKGKVLMPTEHVLHVIAAGQAGERVLQAKVYDGASDPARVYDTLTVIGRGSTDPANAPAPAKAALAGRTSFPVTVSYYEEGEREGAPAYVMSFTLYDNGVVGALKIDYGRFALLGTMSSFETLPAPPDCAR